MDKFRDFLAPRSRKGLSSKIVQTASQLRETFTARKGTRTLESIPASRNVSIFSARHSSANLLEGQEAKDSWT